MVKRTIVTVALVGLAAGGVLGTDLLSYLSTASRTARQSLEDQVPVAFELRRLKDMVSQLDGEILHHARGVAREQVEVETLESETAQARDELAWLRETIRNGRAQIDQATNAQRAQLAHQLDQYKLGQANLERREKALEAQLQSVRAAEEKLHAMISSKRELEVEIESLAALNASVEATRAGKPSQFDSSRLARAKNLVEELRKRVEEESHLLENQGRLLHELGDQLPEPEPPQGDLKTKIDQYFGTTPESHDTAS